jgi:small subunit ribosomal protein S17
MERGKPKVREGIVVSNKMDKTVVVRIERVFRHPLYQKVIKVANKLKAHDADNTCSIGDRVEIRETRPISKDKRWRVVKTLVKSSARPKEIKIDPTA